MREVILVLLSFLSGLWAVWYKQNVIFFYCVDFALAAVSTSAFLPSHFPCHYQTACERFVVCLWLRRRSWKGRPFDRVGTRWCERGWRGGEAGGGGRDASLSWGHSLEGFSVGATGRGGGWAWAWNSYYFIDINILILFSFHTTRLFAKNFWFCS